MNKQKRAACCEQCSYYDYDEYSEEYICSANMDEDEFMRFISGPGSYCPYFDPYDEYKIVSRQNWCFTLANRKKCVILFKKINSENAVTKTVGIYDAVKESLRRRLRAHTAVYVPKFHFRAVRLKNAVGRNGFAPVTGEGSIGSLEIGWLNGV